MQAKKTPLHMAAQNGQLDVCNALISLSADAKAIDGVNTTMQSFKSLAVHENFLLLIRKWDIFCSVPPPPPKCFLRHPIICYIYMLLCEKYSTCAWGRKK